MPDIAAIRTGLATRLATIPNLQASAYMSSQPDPASAHVFPEEVDYDQSFHRGLDYLYFTVQVFVSTNLDESAQIQLDTFLAPTGANSVKTAIEADRTLGGAAQDTRVVSCGGYTTYPRGDGTVLLGADFRVQVLSN